MTVLLRLLERAARDGHTVVPATVARALLAGLDRPVAELAADGVAALDDELLALEAVARAEEAVADEVRRLVRTGGSLRVVVGRAPDALAGEAHALGLRAAADLLARCPDGAAVTLAGEPGAVSPPGPGRVLADLVASRLVAVCAGPVADGSLGELVAAVRDGTLPPVPADPQRRVVVVRAEDAAEAASRVVQLVTDSIPRALGLAADDVQVLTPLRRGAAGAVALNAALKERLNPGPGALGGFDPGDRVVTPAGATGMVIGPAGEDALTVAGLGALPRHRLRHGWAMTVTRAAGGRWPAVVTVFPPDAAGVLGRPLALTAFTRAEQHLSVVHAAGPALARAVRDVALPRRRRTRLAALLRPAAVA